jgi:glycosyltransferase involved in cell wall biosynthesis
VDLPLVSVLLPTYNHAEFIGEALEGVSGQEYPRLEIIVADDGSTDGTLAAVEDWRGRSGVPLKVIRGDHVGIARNLNRGLKECRGRYVAFTAGDDVLLPGKIGRQVEWLEADERRVLCGHDVEVFDSDSGRTLYLWSERFPMCEGMGASMAVHSVPFCATAIMCRASAMPRGGFDERLPTASDWKFWVDCLHPERSFGYVEGVLARYRRHSRNVTREETIDDAERQLAESLLVVRTIEKDHASLSSACRLARSDRLLEHGKRRWAAGQRLRGATFLARAGIASPGYFARVVARNLSRALS